MMVFGHNRIPIVNWLRGEANTCLSHANQAGELVTHFGEHPSLKIGALLETHKHGINDILLEPSKRRKQAWRSTNGCLIWRSIVLFCLKTMRGNLLRKKNCMSVK